MKQSKKIALKKQVIQHLNTEEKMSIRGGNGIDTLNTPTPIDTLKK